MHLRVNKEELIRLREESLVTKINHALFVEVTQNAGNRITLEMPKLDALSERVLDTLQSDYGIIWSRNDKDKDNYSYVFEF